MKFLCEKAVTELLCVCLSPKNDARCSITSEMDKIQNWIKCVMVWKNDVKLYFRHISMFDYATIYPNTYELVSVL